jgi:hypothetical protein
MAFLIQICREGNPMSFYSRLTAATANYHYSRPQIEAAAQQGIITTPTNEPQPGKSRPTSA